MRVVVLYNDSSEEAAVHEQDVLRQRDAVCASLDRLGHQAVPMACTLNLAEVRQRLLEHFPDVVFNLVESLGGTDRLMHLATSLLDALGFAYTGVATDSLLQTNNKVRTKRMCREAGLPVPDWWCSNGADAFGDGTDHPPSSPKVQRRAILKPVWEHASVGMDDTCVVQCKASVDVSKFIRRREQATGRAHFAEQFVDGREFNLSLLTSGRQRPRSKAAGEVELLPPAEIDFLAFPPDKPKIVGHRAKWDEESFEYAHTTRRFEFRASDGPLLDELRRLARRCWELFNLRGYARVDFRVDENGMPWILEVNANPCLSLDAGLAAAAERGGIGYDQAIERIVVAAMP